MGGSDLGRREGSVGLGRGRGLQRREALVDRVQLRRAEDGLQVGTCGRGGYQDEADNSGIWPRS